MDFENRIIVSNRKPDVRSGKPYIRGARIAVYGVLEDLAGGVMEPIPAGFPSLVREDLCTSERDKK